MTPGQVRSIATLRQLPSLEYNMEEFSVTQHGKNYVVVRQYGTKRSPNLWRETYLVGPIKSIRILERVTPIRTGPVYSHP